VLEVGARDDLAALNNLLAEAAIYNRLVQKNIAVSITIRNAGKFDQHTVRDVDNMLSGVRVFMA
jgi:hypothetical protein